MYIKWRPLTYTPNLVDEAGNFFPMVWKNENYPPNQSIAEADWTIEEMEQELRHITGKQPDTGLPRQYQRPA